MKKMKNKYLINFILYKIKVLYMKKIVRFYLIFIGLSTYYSLNREYSSYDANNSDYFLYNSIQNVSSRFAE